MAETDVTPSTTPTNGATPAPSAPAPRPTPKVIAAGKTGGSMGVDSFLRSLGEPELVDEPDPESEEDVRSSIDDDIDDGPSAQDLSKEKESEDEPKPEDEEETDEPKKEASKSGKTITIKGAEGQPDINIPDDAVVLWKVDGEVQEINLKEHLGIVAGELTVQQRMGKLASYREELKRENETIKAERREQLESQARVLDLFKKGNSSAAFCEMAEQAGTSPVAMYRQMLKEIDTAYKSFEGWSPHQIENHFQKMELDWRDSKEKSRAEKEQREQSVNSFLKETDAVIRDQGLSHEDFRSAVDTIMQKNPEQWQAQSREDRRESAIEFALYNKHVGLVAKAIDSVNPKLRDDEKLISDVLKVTDPHNWTDAEIAQLIKELMGSKIKSVATNLSKRAGISANSQKNGVAKPKEKKSFRSLTDMRDAFLR